LPGEISDELSIIFFLLAMQTQRTLSNLQQELLKLYARNVSDDDLLAIKEMLALYFAQKAEAAIEAAWDTQGLVPDDMHGWANEHHRATSAVGQ
jgi:hypothetical protein